ncbi:MAG: adenylate/guanylate cyclase domain-containing protein [Verrucomicrobiae bacterium]|nr:adenylate/guanylate cyclase domain-containing protein [Verrucomicrobiae bacterium]
MGTVNVEPVSDALGNSLAQSRQRNAAFMNRMRFVLATAFLALYWVAILGLKEENFRLTSVHLAIYWVVATALWAFAGRSSLILGISRFAVPLIDMPMATWIQHTTVRHSDHGETTAVFTVALFLFLIVLSSFSLRARHLLLTGIVGIIGLMVVYSAANLTVVSWIAGPLLLAVTAAMMSWLPKRQGALIREAAERQAKRDRLARYFSPGVAEVIEQHDEPTVGESCEITVLFCDIRGFTRMSEKLDAPSVVNLLNDFLGHMVEEVFRNGGTLDKYLGDGLLAYFNAPVRQPDHSRRAVLCALAMIDRLEEFNQARAKIGKEPLGIGIGVHSGTAVVGNIGAEHRREFTAIGDTVNVASRLQSLTRQRNTNILVSETVAGAIPEESRTDFVLEAAGEAEVRGREQGVKLFVPHWKTAKSV